MGVRPRRIVLLACLAIFALGLYYLYGGSATPAGQPTLSRLTSANFGDLKTTFNAASGRVRVIAMLAPT
jgi:hypothetical protein